MPLCGPIVQAETLKCDNKGMWAKVWFTESSQTLRSDVIYCITNKPSMFITSGSCPPMKINVQVGNVENVQLLPKPPPSLFYLQQIMASLTTAT